MASDFNLFPPVITNFGVFKGGPPASKPSHFHCPSCWAEDFYVQGTERRCARCHQSSAPVMLLCTPLVCPSS